MYVSGIIYSRTHILTSQCTPHTRHNTLSQISVLELDNLRAECPQLQRLLPVLGQAAQCPLPDNHQHHCHCVIIFIIPLPAVVPVFASLQARLQGAEEAGPEY